MIITDKLIAVSVNWSFDRRIPALGGYTDIFEERLAMIDRLSEKYIDEFVLRIKACVEEGDTDDAIWGNSDLWLELVCAISYWVVVYANGSRPCLPIIF